MNFSPAKCYKDLMVEFLDMAVGGMSCFQGFEDYHREYLVDYDIEYLEELVKKFSKKVIHILHLWQVWFILVV